MARFPVAYVGQPITADFWNSSRPDWYVKGTATVIASDNTLNDDPELAGIALAVGTYYVRGRYFTQLGTANTPGVDIRIAWTFSGTATGARMTMGMDTGVGVNQYFNGAHVNTTSIRSLIRMASTSAFTSSITYGLNDNFGQQILEDGVLTVTAPGNLTLQWCQDVSSAVTLQLNSGSYLAIDQIG